MKANPYFLSTFIDMNYLMVTPEITRAIQEQQKENTATIAETKSDVEQLLQKEAANSIQTNSITILLTLGITGAAIYFVFAKHILPRLDKAWNRFEVYLDNHISTSASIAANAIKLKEEQAEHHQQTKENTSNILGEIKSVDRKIDELKLEVVRSKMSTPKE